MKRSDVVVRVDTDRLRLAVDSAKASAQSLQVALQHAQHELKRGLDLFAKKVISQDTLDDLRFAERAAAANFRGAEVQVAAAERNLADAQVRVPFAGQLESVNVQVGDYVTPGRAIFTLTDFSQARIQVGLSSQEAAGLTPGQRAAISFTGIGGSNVTGEVISVGRVKNQRTGTFPVELLVREHALPLREGMVAQVQWSPTAQRNTLHIPAKAVFRRGGAFSVYVVNGGQAQQREVATGRSVDDQIEILSGLSEHEIVVTDGLFALRDGVRVQVSN